MGFRLRRLGGVREEASAWRRLLPFPVLSPRRAIRRWPGYGWVEFGSSLATPWSTAASATCSPRRGFLSASTTARRSLSVGPPTGSSDDNGGIVTRGGGGATGDGRASTTREPPVLSRSRTVFKVARAPSTWPRTATTCSSSC